MKKIIKKKFFLYSLALIIFLLGYYFIIKTFEENMMFFLDPSAIDYKNYNKEIMLGGYVKDGSYKIYQNENNKTKHFFIITDFNKDIIVNYVGQLPALFREGQGVIAKGQYSDREKIFFAKEILAKHDEKYMPKAYYKKMKDNNQLINKVNKND